VSVNLNSIAGVQQAFSSGIDSIATGLAKATQAGGLSEVKNTLEAFQSEGNKPFDAAGIQGFKEIAGPGFLAPPGEFFSKLALAQAPTGKFQALDLANKLVDTSQDPRAQVDGLISSLEEQLNSIGDDAQLANVDLQNTSQKVQQLLQMLSNISKMNHDNAMSMIRKISG